jgi:hypothetical protein
MGDQQRFEDACSRQTRQLLQMLSEGNQHLAEMAKGLDVSWNPAVWTC